MKLDNLPYRILAKLIVGKKIPITDKTYLSILYRASFGKHINWESPVTFNEKLQWMKIYDRQPIYTKLVDKYEVRQVVEKKIGKEFLIPLLGVWDSFEDIDFDKLPKQFVLKCTHDSGSVVICDNKESFDKESAKKKLIAAMKKNYFWKGREWPYYNVTPRIIAEEYIRDIAIDKLNDYKFFCFNGECKFMYVARDRDKGHDKLRFDYYDANYIKLPVRQATHLSSTREYKKPDEFDKMREIAETLSKGLREVRIDLYAVNGKIFFGEYTFFNQGGMVPFVPDKYDEVFGQYIKL